MTEIVLRRQLLICFIVLITCCESIAQDTTYVMTAKQLRQYKKTLPPQKGRFYIIAAPSLGYTPTNGFIYGAAGTASLYLGEPSTTSISSAIVLLNYTTKKQLLFTARSSIYSQNNNWIFNGDWRYLNTSQPIYGFGTGPLSSKLASNGFEIADGVYSKPINEEQLLGYTQIRFYETIYKEVKEHLFLGLGYHLDIFKDFEDHLLDTTVTPPVITSIYYYNEKYGLSQISNTLSGISLNATFDTRDNQNNAYKGQYANVSFRFNTEFMGSNKNSSLLSFDYRKFLNLTKDHHNMLCFWGIGSFTTSGNMPALDLPAIGEDQYNRSGRGYKQGRFRGQKLVYGEIEYRRHLLGIKDIPDFFGLVVFANATTATNKDADINLFEYVNLGAGAGLRFMINQISRSSVCIDYAWGNYGSRGLYVKLNETF
jgi:outer membrane protein assembly factor BamA